MTVVTYDRERFSVKAKGHAGYASEGQDIVCSSISTLFFALACYSTSLNDKSMLKSNPVIKLEKGACEITIEPLGIFKREAHLMFDAMASGFEWLSRDYHGNVHYERI